MDRNPAPAKRKGPQKMSYTSAARLAELHAGAPASNLVEQLAIDFAVLIETAFSKIGEGANAQHSQSETAASFAQVIIRYYR